MNTQNAAPSLIGTPKQVAWAEEIRANTLAKCDEYAQQIAGKFGPEGVAVVSEFLAQTVKRQTKATWFIDGRELEDGVYAKNGKNAVWSRRANYVGLSNVKAIVDRDEFRAVCVAAGLC